MIFHVIGYASCALLSASLVAQVRRERKQLEDVATQSLYSGFLQGYQASGRKMTWGAEQKLRRIIEQRPKAGGSR